MEKALSHLNKKRMPTRPIPTIDMDTDYLDVIDTEIVHKNREIEELLEKIRERDEQISYLINHIFSLENK